MQASTGPIGNRTLIGLVAMAIDHLPSSAPSAADKALEPPHHDEIFWVHLLRMHSMQQTAGKRASSA